MSSASLPLSPHVREWHDRYLQAQTRRRLDAHRPLSREAARIVAEFLTEPPQRTPRDGTLAARVLTDIRTHGPSTIREVADRLGIDYRRAGAAITPLGRQGDLIRHPHPDGAGRWEAT